MSVFFCNFISNWKSHVKIQKISQITNFLENFLIPNWGINAMVMEDLFFLVHVYHVLTNYTITALF